MAKRRYKAVWVKDVEAVSLAGRLSAGNAVVGIDVGKEDFFAAVMDPSRRVVETVRWKHPEQSRLFIHLVTGLKALHPELVAAMEPSGVYGDAVRFALWDAGLSVYRVSPKRSHDAAEVYDGVPSWHDAKSAAVVGKLHLDGASESWPKAPEHQRGLTASLRVFEVHHKEAHRNRNRLEGFVTRYWPEVSGILSLHTATLVELLGAYGGPAAVAEQLESARALMRRVGGYFLASEKVDAVLASASSTFGVPMLEPERQMVMAVATEARRQQVAANKARRKVEELSSSQGDSKAMAPVVGRATAAVLVASVGNPGSYDSATAYEKALGLNLKEKSSGKQQGALHITKRGPGLARLVLYLATLRLIQREPIVRAWYAKKVNRDAGRKQKALVAIMRKLSRALWYVAQGDSFDANKLFDVKRLDVTELTLRAA